MTVVWIGGTVVWSVLMVVGSGLMVVWSGGTVMWSGGMVVWWDSGVEWWNGGVEWVDGGVEWWDGGGSSPHSRADICPVLRQLAPQSIQLRLCSAARPAGAAVTTALWARGPGQDGDLVAQPCCWGLHGSEPGRPRLWPAWLGCRARPSMRWRRWEACRGEASLLPPASQSFPDRTHTSW